jgi:hypothetical protein
MIAENRSPETIHVILGRWSRELIPCKRGNSYKGNKNSRPSQAPDRPRTRNAGGGNGLLRDVGADGTRRIDRCSGRRGFFLAPLELRDIAAGYKADSYRRSPPRRIILDQASPDVAGADADDRVTGSVVIDSPSEEPGAKKSLGQAVVVTRESAANN